MSSIQDQNDKENERLFGEPQSRPRQTKKKTVGMTDEEIIASGVGLESSKRVPKWFWAIIVVVVLVAYGLTIPFWGDRVDSPRAWFTWGHVGAFAYMTVFGGFVYFMTTMYGDSGEDEDDMDEHDIDEHKNVDEKR